MEAVTKLPELKFWHNGGEPWIRARGGRAFDRWAQLGRNVEQTSVVRSRIDKTTWALMSCPTNPLLADQVATIAKCPDCCIAVDVPFPITALNHVAGDEASRDYWADPEHRATALRAIEAADVVTVPVAAWPGYPQFLDDMKVFNPNTIVLPDLDDSDESVEVFMRTLTMAWGRAVRAKA